MPVKEKQGTEITTERGKAVRWVQNFKEGFNISDLMNRQHQMTLLAFTLAYQFKNRLRQPAGHEVGKAPGMDAGQTGMLKPDITKSAKVLKDLFRKIWEQDAWPQDWRKCLILMSYQ